MVKVKCGKCGKLVFETKDSKPVFGNYICSTCDNKLRMIKKLKEKQAKANK